MVFAHMRVIVIIAAAPPSRKEVSHMEVLITTFLVSVAAGIVSYFFCKWLDGNE